MATINGLSKQRMLDDEAATVISGSISGDNLHLTTKGGTIIDAGNVRGPQGSQGVQGTPGINGVQGGTSAQRDSYFGVPTVLTDQVTLANKAPLWYNVTTGNLETYYVPSGSAGLTVPGFYSAPGWYLRDVADKEPLGLTALSEMAFNSGSSTALTIVQNIASFTFRKNRHYLIKWSAGIVYTSGSGAALAQLWSCATTDGAGVTTGLTELMGWNLDFRTANQTIRTAVERHISYTVDTTLQIKSSFNGNGSTLYGSGGATYPMQLTIEDRGRQF